MNRNPYTTETRARRPDATSSFSREVYRSEEPKSQTDELRAALAALRAEVRSEVRALRAALMRPRTNELSGDVNALRADVDALLGVQNGARSAVSNAIRVRGIEGAAATELARVGKTKGRGKNQNERLRAAVESMVSTTAWPVSSGATLIALVGPAGVGKTTTIAKLGARIRRSGKTVAFVSCDGYRVGAMDQLGRYAAIMESEFHEVTTPEELLAVVEGSTADVVLGDTSGRTVEAGSVEATLGDPRLRDASATRRAEVILCAPGALRASDANRIARDFAVTKPTSLCLTKLDETDAPSALLHLPFATKLPVGTLCFGQRVPEDVGPATTGEIAARLFPCEPAAPARAEKASPAPEVEAP